MICFFDLSSFAHLLYICAHSKAGKVNIFDRLPPLTKGIGARYVISHYLAKALWSFAWLDFDHT